MSDSKTLYPPRAYVALLVSFGFAFLAYLVHPHHVSYLCSGLSGFFASGCGSICHAHRERTRVR